MKLARKLTLAIIAGILAIMGFAAASRVQRETLLFEQDMSRDHQFIGRALRDALVSIGQSEGVERAELLLQATNARDPHIAIRIVSLDATPRPDRRPMLPRTRIVAVLSGGEVDVNFNDRLYTYIPFALHGQRLALELAESLEDERRYIRSSILNNALALCGIVFVCSMLAIALGYLFVGRPMSRLTEKARRIGAGDLTGPLEMKQKDEIAEFAVEMNAMCDRLAEAHERIGLETQEKIAALEQLRHADRLRTVGQLASGLAHELGTPLNVVLGRARMILAGDNSAEESAENARIIADQAARMTALIRQLLDFARPRGPNFQSVNLSDLARQTVEMLGPLAEKREVKLGVNACADDCSADVDPTQIQQALANLVVNAIQAMSTGGRVTIETGTRDARPPADHGGREREYRFVVVRDQGEGIAKEHFARIFEPFFTTKGVGEGTGLGLSVTYGIVRDHAGWIAVESEKGRGSAFTIYIPPQRTESIAPAQRSRISSTLLTSAAPSGREQASRSGH